MFKSENHNPDFKTLFEAAPGLSLVLSPELKIVAVSNAYLKATMTSRDEIIGKGIFEVFPDNPEDPTASGVGNLKASLERVLQHKVADAMAVQKYDIQRPESEGGGFEEKYWSPLNTPVCGKTSQVLYIIHKVEDVTEFIKLKQKRTEQQKLTEELKTKADEMESEIFRRAQEIQEANQKLRDAEKIKNEFFASVSHELRTPLSLILAPLESIISGKYGEVPKAQIKLLHLIHNNSIRLLQMVNGLLDFAKFEAGKMKAHREATDIERLFRSILNDFESVMGGKKVNLSYEIECEGKNILIDRYLIERIVFNLLSNAAKFTPNGGSVSVRANVNGEQLIFSVEDTGIGIPEYAMKNLFQKFSQVEGSSIRRFEGTGLGLAMVKEFAELLGGSVSVKSTDGEGSIFTIHCHAPLTEVTPEKEPSIPIRKNLFPKYDVDNNQRNSSEESNLLKVLVCEDNEELSSYIASLLHGICQTRIANNGLSALEDVHAWNPDLVLSDVMMPEKDGIEVCRTIKSDPATSKIPVVLLTALTHRDSMMKGWEAKADEYLFKPFHPEELITRIRSMLSSLQDRKKADMLIQEKNDELMRVNSDLEAFSYSVSHDLRSPLRSIMGYTQVLEEDYIDKIDEEGKRTLSVIHRNAWRMNKLIDDLLNFSKVDRIELQPTLIDHGSIVQSIVSEIQSNYISNFKIHTLLPSKGMSSLITQVWQNLISNALKYSSKVETPIIEIGSYREEAEIVYYIKDNGSGFSMEQSGKLFVIFQRLHKTSEYEGTGIGLALIKRIVNKFGGRVWADGKLNEGATFYFSLPYK